jgi:hypothetical protein
MWQGAGTGLTHPGKGDHKNHGIYVCPENDMTPNFFIRGGLFFTFN